MPLSKAQTLFFGIVFYLLFLVANLPAQQVVTRLPLPNNIAISGVSGTIWNGNAASVYADGIRIFNVDWSLSLLPLLVGNVSADIKGGSQRQADQVAINGYFTVSSSHLAAQDAQIFIPTDMVMAKLAIPLPVNASGRFKVKIDEARYSNQCETLEATGEWLNSGVMGTTGNIPLGNFSANITCQENVIKVAVDGSNKLGLDAVASLTPQGDIAVQGKFKVAQDLPKEVHNAARFFGAPDSDGFYQIRF